MNVKLLLRLAILALPLAATACENSDLFAEKKTPLPGVREPLFPNGVPGVDYTAPPAQPTNSNIPINTAVQDPAEQQQQAEAAKQEEKQGAARGKPRNQRANAQPVDPNDPWGGARTAQPD